MLVANAIVVLFEKDELLTPSLRVCALVTLSGGGDDEETKSNADSVDLSGTEEKKKRTMLLKFEDEDLAREYLLFLRDPKSIKRTLRAAALTFLVLELFIFSCFVNATNDKEKNMFLVFFILHTVLGVVCFTIQWGLLSQAARPTKTALGDVPASSKVPVKLWALTCYTTILVPLVSVMYLLLLIQTCGDQLDEFIWYKEQVSRAVCEYAYAMPMYRQTLGGCLVMLTVFGRATDFANKIGLVVTLESLFIVVLVYCESSDTGARFLWGTELALFLGFLLLYAGLAELGLQQLFLQHRSLQMKKDALERRVTVLMEKRGAARSTAQNLLKSFGRDVGTIESPAEKARQMIIMLMKRCGDLSKTPDDAVSRIQEDLELILDVTEKQNGPDLANLVGDALEGADKQTKAWAQSALSPDGVLHGKLLNRASSFRHVVVRDTGSSFVVAGESLLAGLSAPTASRLPPLEEGTLAVEAGDGFDVNQWPSPKSDIFALSVASEERPLSAILQAVLHQDSMSDVLAEMNVSMRAILEVAAHLDSDYASERNTYHTNTHAADVLHSVHFFLTQPPLSTALPVEECLSLYLAAAFHDFGHLGWSNGYVIASRHGLSLTYTDDAVQERMHISKCLKLLQSIHGAWPARAQDGLLLRKLMTVNILATDLSRSGEYITEFNGHLDRHTGKPEDIDGHLFTDERARRCLLCMVLKLCDVSHPLKPLESHLKWTRFMLKEFLMQGSDEEKANLPLTPLCDRKTLKPASAQTGFIDFVVRPMVEPLFNVLVTTPSTDQLVHNLRDNYAYWKAMNEEGLDNTVAIERILNGEA